MTVVTGALTVSEILLYQGEVEYTAQCSTVQYSAVVSEGVDNLAVTVGSVTLLEINKTSKTAENYGQNVVKINVFSGKSNYICH